MGDASASGTTQVRPSCLYGDECYRSNPRHRLEQAHPGDEDYTISQLPTPVDGAPKCKYGRHCYRRNAEHFRDFRHPRNFNSDNRTSADETYDDDSEDDPFADSEGGSDYVPSEEDD